MTKRVSPSCPPHDARNLRDKHPELKQKISELQNEINQLQQGHSNAESNLKALTVLPKRSDRMTDGARSRLLGATICAVPLSQPLVAVAHPLNGFRRGKLQINICGFPLIQ